MANRRFSDPYASDSGAVRREGITILRAISKLRERAVSRKLLGIGHAVA
jgi:hypothetical protein